MQHHGADATIGEPAQQLLHQLPGNATIAPLRLHHHRLHPAGQAIEAAGGRGALVDDGGRAAQHLAGLLVLGGEDLHAVALAQAAAQPTAIRRAPLRRILRGFAGVAGRGAVQQVGAQFDQASQVGQCCRAHGEEGLIHLRPPPR
ncbi:hypothetical protein FQZ97_1095040 [compost metagenome]